MQKNINEEKKKKKALETQKKTLKAYKTIALMGQTLWQATIKSKQF